jgi:hypothetical protein
MAFIPEGVVMIDQKSLPDWEQQRVAAIRQALKIATSLVYLAKATPSRDNANIYLVRAGEQLKTIGVLLDGISNQEQAAS